MRVWLVGIGILLLAFAVAFLSLDLIFRSIPVEASRLRQGLRRSGRLFAALAAGFAGLGGWTGFSLVGPWALAPVPLYLVPWWLLWRFGVRKQFTFLFEPSERTKEPVP